MFKISKLLNKNKFTSTVSKYVDLIDYTIKNGSLFNKYNDKRIDKYAIFDIVTNNNYMLLNEMAYLNKDKNYFIGYKTESFNAIIQDKNDINIYYFMSNDNNKRLYICDIKNKTLDYVNTKSYYDGISNFIGQDDEYIYFMSYYLSSSNYSSSYYHLGTIDIQKMDKKRLSVSSIYSTSGNNPLIEKGMYDNELVFYYVYESYFYKNTINLTQGTSTDSKSFSISQNNKNYITTDFNTFKNSDNIYFVTNSSYTNTNFNFYKYNKKTDKLTTMNLQKEFLTSLSQNYNHSLRTFIVKKQDKEYLVFAPTLLNNYRNNKTPYNDGVKMYLFEINNDNLRLIDELSSQNISYTNLIYQEDTGLFIWGNYKHINFVIVNDDLKLESVYLHNGLFENFGIGTENDVYIQNNDSSIDKLDKGNDVYIKCKFEKNIYKFSGKPINSFMEIEIKNFLGQHLEKDVQLILQGNVTFEDGSKEKTIKTSKTGKTTLPIIVKTNTRFDCNVEIIRKEK